MAGTQHRCINAHPTRVSACTLRTRWSVSEAKACVTQSFYRCSKRNLVLMSGSSIYSFAPTILSTRRAGIGNRRLAGSRTTFGVRNNMDTVRQLFIVPPQKTSFYRLFLDRRDRSRKWYYPRLTAKNHARQSSNGAKEGRGRGHSHHDRPSLFCHSRGDGRVLRLHHLWIRDSQCVPASFLPQFAARASSCVLLHCFRSRTSGAAVRRVYFWALRGSRRAEGCVSDQSTYCWGQHMPYWSPARLR